uniref:ARAD1C43076p n=1 Tax=Blastobotrys adeninivorans TaxID=409370 RepID=A0A060TA72_BLAAD
MTLLIASLLLPQTVSFSIKDGSRTPVEQSAPVRIPENPKRTKSDGMPLSRQVSPSPIPDIVHSLAQTQLGQPSEETSTSSTPGPGSPDDKFFFAPSKLAKRGTSSPMGLSPPQNLVPQLASRVVSGPSGLSNVGSPSSAASSGHGSRATQPPSRAQTPVQKNLTNPRKPVSNGPTVVPAEHIPSRRNSINQSRRLSNDMKIFSDAPWTVEAQVAGNGGLRNSIRRAQADGIVTDLLWVGTLGIPTDALSGDKKQSIEDCLMTEHECLPVFVDDSTFEGHYSHYCKQILWPTLHYQVPDDPKSKAYLDHSWEHYKKLNQAVADRIVKIHKPGDIVWVNDYHLLLVPEMVRRKLPDAKIGLFLHVAFPSSEVFRCLAARRELLEGMLGSNCIGFQIPEYSQHFLQTCNRILATDVTAQGIRYEGKFVSVIDLAIGIDAGSLTEQMCSDEVQRWRKMIRERWSYDKKLIVARDKLEHVRGIKEKLLAYEEFLRKHPEWIENAVLIQVCLSSVVDMELEGEVSKIVDRINSYRTNLASSQPVVFLQQDIDFQQYLALLQEADAFVVSSLREGMNLTCHEFVFCNRSDINGPLILSEFTGAASLLGKSAILVNPWDRKQLAQAFYDAVTMDSSERARRSKQLRQYVTKYSAQDWVGMFREYIVSSWKESEMRKTNSLHRLELPKFEQQYSSVKAGKKRLFFLNLDRIGAAETGNGTMSRLSSHLDLKSLDILDHPSSTALRQSPTPSPLISPQRKISVLYELVSDPANIVYVISADTRATLERLFRRVGNVGLIAENGAYMRPYGSDKWESYVDTAPKKQWKPMVREMLQAVEERLPGSWVQMNENSIFFHANTTAGEDPERVSMIVGELINHVNDAFESQNIRARLTEAGRVVIGDDDISKVPAVKRAYEQCADQVAYLFVAAEGASTEDNDRLFEWARKGVDHHDREVCTVALGSTGTLAEWVLEGVNGLLSALLTVSRA